MKRHVLILVLAVVFSVPVWSQDKADSVAFEKGLIADIDAVSKDVAAEINLCEKRDPGCSLRRVITKRQVLGELVKHAEALQAELLDRQKTEDDSDERVKLAQREADLHRAVKGTRELLVSRVPSPEELDEEEKAKAEEKKIIDELVDVVQKVKDMEALCARKDDDCSRTTLANLRSELQDRLDEAREVRADLMKKEAESKKPDEAVELSKRAAAILAAINTANDISFDARRTDIAGDELVDTVKALGEKLDSLVAAREDFDTYIQKKQISDKANLSAEGTDRDKEKKALKKEINRTSRDLAAAEHKLREQGISDRETISSLEKKLSSGTLSDKQYSDNAKKKENLEKRLEETQELVTLPSNDNPLFRVYDDDHEDWWIHEFYAGMEFDSVSGIFNKGFARIGYSASLHVGGESIPESRPARGLRLGYGRLYEFNALLTSSAEQSFKSAFNSEDDSTVTDPCDPDFAGTDPCIRKALEVEEKLFWPLYRTPRHNRVRPYFGPVLSLGARFIDPSKADHDQVPSTLEDDQDQDKSARADYRYYAGLHWGFARDAYGEILYGRTRSLQTRRIEVRGEIPVAHFGNDSRLLLGWSANLGAGHLRSKPSEDVEPLKERDVFRIFLVYDLDFLKLPIGVKPPKAKED